MTALPHELGEALLRRIADARQTAWLRVDDRGAVRESGGDLARLGLSTLRAGADAGAELGLLEGLLPLADPLELPAVRLPGGATVDVLLVPAEGGAWLLLDGAEEHVREVEALQQRLHELTLDLPGTVELALSDLGAALLERGEDGTFRLLTAAPAWLADLAGERDPIAAARHPGELSPFLEHFLTLAEEFWAVGEIGRWGSGPWEETSPAGRDWPLEATALRLRSGAALLLVRQIQDVFEERRRILTRAREHQLEYEALRREIEKKEVLLHCIVHDLKGPLSVMAGSLALLRRPTLDDDKRAELLDLAIGQANRQREMIELVLDVFAAELAAMEAWADHPLAAPDARACAAASVDDYLPAFRAAGLGLRLDESGAQARAHVCGRRDQLDRVLANLLENARRHAPPDSEVVLGISTSETAARMWVDDEGPGVSPAVVERLFGRFVRDPSSGGTAGLGLYFCRTTIARWGGSIGYEPRQPRGARFWIELPRTDPIR